jgi:hypothetical protein
MHHIHQPKGSIITKDLSLHQSLIKFHKVIKTAAESELLQKFSDARATRQALRHTPRSSQLLRPRTLPVVGWSARPDEFAAASTELDLSLCTQ